MQLLKYIVNFVSWKANKKIPPPLSLKNPPHFSDRGGDFTPILAKPD